MMRNSRVLTREANPISLISAVQASSEAEYLVAAQREVMMSTIQQTWRLEVADRAPADRTTPGHVNPLVRIMKWLSYLGSRGIDDSYLKSRPSFPPNFRIGGGPGL
jgi:hypothetical protein